MADTVPKDEKREIIQADMFMGVNTLDDPITLDPSESPYSVNMDITKSGQMISRFGYEKVCELPGTGGMVGLLPYYRTYGGNEGDYLVFFYDGDAYYITNENTTPQLIGAYGNENGVVRGTTAINYLVFGNGASGNTPKKWDGTTLADLQNTPPNGRYFGTYANWLFVAGVASAPSTVYYPENETIDTNWEFFPVKEGDGQDVTSLVDGQNRLTVLKEDGIFGVDYSFDDTFNITAPRVQPDLSIRGGAYMPGSVQPVFGYFYFLARNGFQSYGPSSESIRSDLPLPLSLKITPTLKAINYLYRDQGSSAFFDEKYLCAAPVGPAATTNNFIFLYNESVKRRFQRDNWTIYKDLPVSQFSVFRNTEKKDELYFTSSSSPALYKFNNTFNDDGLGYERIWRSKTFQFGERTYWEYLDLYGSKTRGGTIYLRVWADGKITDNIAITDANLINNAEEGGLLGSEYVGDAYIGDGYYADTALPMYKWKKRFRFTGKVKESYNMYFELYNSAADEGWSLSKYKLVCIPQPDDPTYPYTD
jgi:hypothetical protein